MLTHPISEQTGQGIQLFTHPSFGKVRTTGTPENPYFCLTDICAALELRAPDVRRRLADDVVSNHTATDTLGRPNILNFVNEDGLYDVILDSRKPEAKAFRKWITSEVLPSIRKTGGYIRQEEGDTDADIMAKALMIARKTIDNKSQRIQMLEGEKAVLMEENRSMAPKAQYTDEVLQSTSTVTFTEVAKELNFRSVSTFLQKLIEDRIIFRQSGRYLPCARYSGHGYFASRTHRYYHTDGSPDTSVMTVVTQKGRMFLFNHFNNVKSEPIDIFNV